MFRTGVSKIKTGRSHPYEWFIAQEVEKAAQQSGYDFDGMIKPNHDKLKKEKINQQNNMDKLISRLNKIEKLIVNK